MGGKARQEMVPWWPLNRFTYRERKRESQEKGSLKVGIPDMVSVVLAG